MTKIRHSIVKRATQALAVGMVPGGLLAAAPLTAANASTADAGEAAAVNAATVTKTGSCGDNYNPGSGVTNAGTRAFASISGGPGTGGRVSTRYGLKSGTTIYWGRVTPGFPVSDIYLDWNISGASSSHYYDCHQHNGSSNANNYTRAPKRGFNATPGAYNWSDRTCASQHFPPPNSSRVFRTCTAWKSAKAA